MLVGITYKAKFVLVKFICKKNYCVTVYTFTDDDLSSAS